ncbi:hypothetical protein L6164_013530 [Bauhinia variegata]|uniref:Uncharacterized protein n=1 Tax=Bauhinia variegata TaxID=167791 RepID=A0ACB9NEZ5_BAUVA|nr:hypothetical protein L6164_013530 [Bauhinia variegata]
MLYKCIRSWDSTKKIIRRRGSAVTWEQARYSLCFDSKNKNKLETNIEDMNENARKSQENTMKVGKCLKHELKEAKYGMKEVDELVKKVEPKKTCCQGPCPDWVWQYRLGRQVANKTEAMKQLNAQFQPQKLSCIKSLPGMEYHSSEDFIPFKSAKKAFDELLKGLKDPKDWIVWNGWVCTLEVRKIQGSIADALKLTLKEDNEPERAKRLYMRLKDSLHNMTSGWISEDASEKSLKGLPVAIAAIANALKDKTLDEWKEACDLLKNYQQVDIANNSKDPYVSLQFSHDHLKKMEAKELFLLCSLFPEDSEIMEEGLIRMGIGLGLFENVYSWDSART